MIFRLEYCNKFGDTVRVDITTPGLPTVVEVEGAGDPFRLKYTPDIPDKSFRFLTSSAEINIYETPEFNIDILKTSSETDIKVEMYVNGVKDWVGFVLPDFFSKEIRGNAVVSMTASDRISTLKGVTLSDLPAFISIRDLAVMCLEKTGLDLQLNTMADFTESGGYNAYFRSEILSQRLVDNKGRSISCYDILSSILVTSNSFLEQRNSEWYIINKLQHELGEGELYSSPNTHTTYSEVTHNFSEITRGAMRTIIPVAASVGVFHEHGGGKLHPDNYDFSNGSTGWTAVNGFNMEIEDRHIKGYKETIPGSPIYEPDYDSITDRNKLASIKNETAGFSFDNIDEKPYIKTSFPIVTTGVDSVEITANISITSIRNNRTIYVILAEKGTTRLALSRSGIFEIFSPTDEKFKNYILTGKDGASLSAVEKVISIKGTLEQSDLTGFTITIRIYGSGTALTSFINFASISFKNTQEVPKGNLYKREQGNNFTKTHEIETSIFGDYITGGFNGYFYDYPIDDTSSLYSPNGNLRERWIDPTDHNREELPLLQHVVRQKARMFSVAHDLIRGEIEMVNFDPLAIFVDCSGKRYSLVSAEVDFLRSNVKLEIEEIAYQNLTVRDFIYSYFGEGESNIKSVGGIASGSGGGAGGGLTPEQIEILSWWKKDPDNPNTIFTEMNAYSKLELSAYGVGDGGGGGGSDYERLDTWADYDSSKSGWVLSALLGNDLNTRVTNLENSGGGGGGSTVEWGTLTNGYRQLTVEGVTYALAQNTHKHLWADITDKPSTFAPSSHTHSAGDITSGTFAIARIPTGTTASTVALGNHLHTGVYEPVFSKNTAFNKNFGTASGTVAEGNHTHSYLPLSGGTLTGNLTAPTFIGSLTGNAASATKLQTARTIWGQSFDGTGNVTGALSGATTGSFSGTITAPLYQSGTYNWVSKTGGFHSSTDGYQTGGLSIYDGTGTTANFYRLDNLLILGRAANQSLTIDTNSNVSILGNTTTNRIVLSSVALEAQLEFSRPSHNYVTAPLNGGISFITNGDSPASLNNILVLSPNGNVGIGKGFTNNTTSITAQLHVRGDILATGTTTTTKVIFNSAGWSMEQVGSELQMKHNNVVAQRFLSDGSIVGLGEITAYGATTGGEGVSLLRTGGTMTGNLTMSADIIMNSGRAIGVSNLPLKLLGNALTYNASNVLTEANTATQIKMGNGWTIEQTTASLTIRKNGVIKGTFNA